MTHVIRWSISDFYELADLNPDLDEVVETFGYFDMTSGEYVLEVEVKERTL